MHFFVNANNVVIEIIKLKINKVFGQNYINNVEKNLAHYVFSILVFKKLAQRSMSIVFFDPSYSEIF